MTVRILPLHWLLLCLCATVLLLHPVPVSVQHTPQEQERSRTALAQAQQVAIYQTNLFREKEPLSPLHLILYIVPLLLLLKSPLLLPFLPCLPEKSHLSLRPAAQTKSTTATLRGISRQTSYGRFASAGLHAPHLLSLTFTGDHRCRCCHTKLLVQFPSLNLTFCCRDGAKQVLVAAGGRVEGFDARTGRRLPGTPTWRTPPESCTHTHFSCVQLQQPSIMEAQDLCL